MVVSGALAGTSMALAAGEATASGDAAESARAYHESGTAHYEEGRFEDAVADYRKAYELRADPGFLFDIGQAYRKLGHDDKALFFYRRFRTKAPDDPRREVVDKLISDLERTVEGERAGARDGEPERQPAPPGEAPTTDGAPPTAPRDQAMDASLLAGAEPARESRPVWKSPWLWVGVGAVVAAGVVVAVVAAAGGSDTPDTSLGSHKFF